MWALIKMFTMRMSDIDALIGQFVKNKFNIFYSS